MIQDICMADLVLVIIRALVLATGYACKAQAIGLWHVWRPPGLWHARLPRSRHTWRSRRLSGIWWYGGYPSGGYGGSPGTGSYPSMHHEMMAITTIITIIMMEKIIFITIITMLERIIITTIMMVIMATIITIWATGEKTVINKEDDDKEDTLADQECF